MPGVGAQVLECLVRFQSRQVLSLTARKVVLDTHLLLQSRAVAKAAEHQAEVGGLAAASVVHCELQKIELLLDALDRAEGAIRTAEAERSSFIEALQRSGVKPDGLSRRIATLQ